MKKKLFFVSVFFFFNIFIGAYPSEKAEVVEKAIDKFKNVGSFYFTKKTITGSFSVAETRGALDYLNQKMWADTQVDNQLIKKVYSKGSKVYIYDGITGEWFKLNKKDYHFDQGFNKKKFFLFFREAAQKNGFAVSVLEKENKGEDAFFVIESRIENKGEAKKYILDNLDIIFGKNVNNNFKGDLDLLDDYLTLYTADFVNTILVSKKDFLPKKRVTIYYQPVGSGDSLRIEESISYFDFNKAVKPELPEAAKAAPTMPVSLQ
ncbi:MAG: hypothetical protein K9L87_05595 [Candidatus Omnitrophica bacterium]|nr:hypothetical protein [Candidatus Omnitrophota bacterium]MCF7892019.1 hypothetical protein [Candidatus Omnitrophota bacterium]MCF7895510.1 hypothetical protein [Candidatus Omnitrophota bacterium]MCF7898204.1 hypothetical protein [Candidatus Omnitrophota bacterium]MCF7909767.1 hypothetical protein [Candidatus Omnitrophota bacterium]